MASACGGDDGGDAWTNVLDEQPSALLSVWGTSSSDVWTVGGRPEEDTGGAPLVLHYDGSAWSQVNTDETATDLWWVFGFNSGPIFMSGSSGTILRYEDGSFENMTTPGDDVVFGMWGSAADDVWAAGGRIGGGAGFVWHYDGNEWSEVAGVPENLTMFKVSGRASDDVWVVGEAGTILHWDGTALTEAPSPTGDSLFSVSCDSSRCVAGGGFTTGVILEEEGAGWSIGAEPEEVVRGIFSTSEGSYAVGNDGLISARGSSEWSEEENTATSRSLHANWIDPDGGVWAVGGSFDSLPLKDGTLIYSGSAEIAPQ